MSVSDLAVGRTTDRACALQCLQAVSTLTHAADSIIRRTEDVRHWRGMQKAAEKSVI